MKTSKQTRSLDLHNTDFYQVKSFVILKQSKILHHRPIRNQIWYRNGKKRWNNPNRAKIVINVDSDDSGDDTL